MALEAVHLLGLALLGGAACITALASIHRTGLRGIPLTTLARGLRPFFVVGLSLMAASGVLIVAAMPFKYYLNTAFRVKMALLVIAIVTTALLLRLSRRPAAAGAERGLALMSALLWLGVGCSGRLIGFL